MQTSYKMHQPVIIEDKVTTKLQIAYDASLTLHGKSLNQSLENVPTKYTELVSAILQFRIHTVALIADIEKVLLSTGVKDAD